MTLDVLLKDSNISPMHNRLLNTISQPALLSYILPILMIYLVIGTIAQKYIGLYESTQIFFSSFILWAGPIPLPGLPIFLGFIFINLMCKLIFKSPWILKNAGIIITHIGAIFLLFGGFLTASFSHEGYIDLSEGEQKSFVSDYHIREFVIINEAQEVIHTFSHAALSKGMVLEIPNVDGLKLEVLEVCRHCEIKKRRFAQDNYYGMAQHMQLDAAPLRTSDEENMSGLTFAIQGSETDGVYLSLENVPKFPQVEIDGKFYDFILRRQQRSLPFTVELLEFKRDMHPGTRLAKSYSSRVRIIDGDAQWESLIQMNEPLRYKGYSLFQSSFISTPAGDVSVLASVNNAGRSFPYISGIAMCLGIILHLFMSRRRPHRTRRETS